MFGSKKSQQPLDLLKLACAADEKIRQNKKTDKENLPDLKNILELYLKAFEAIFSNLKVERDEKTKETLKKELEVKMVRAEELKTSIRSIEQISMKKSDTYNYSSTSLAKNSNKISDLLILPPSDQNLIRKNIKESKSSNLTTPETHPDIKNTPSSSSNKVVNEYETQILQDLLDVSPNVRWEDVSGLHLAKQTMQETVILPNLRPDIFTGLRSPPKGVLLYGPPGTGKTLLAKAVANESKFSFFNISASSITSKYMGEGERLMKTLFELARKKQPSVIFFDEIDALMGSRKEGEHEASRRIKTEFMIQVDGAATTSSDRILVIGATNTPWDLDEAVLRRMSKRIYVPLPDEEGRLSLINNLMQKHLDSSNQKTLSGKSMIVSFLNSFKSDEQKDKSLELSSILSVKELSDLVLLTEGYSGSDLSALCKEAAMGPVRELTPELLRTVQLEDMRALNFNDFLMALQIIRPSVSPDNLKHFDDWGDLYGITK